MNPKHWKEMKQALLNRGFKVSVKGKSKKEYIAEKDFVIVNILRGGLSGCGSTIVMYVFDPKENRMVLDDENSNYHKLLSNLDCVLDEYKEFGEFV